MPQHIYFSLSDHAGDPLSGQSPSIVVYRRADGTAAAPVPPVLEVGGGFYQFEVDPAAHGPVAYAVDCGGDSAVQYLVGSVGELVAFAMYDVTGDLDGTRSPAFTTYNDGAGEVPSPTIVNLSGGLYGFWPVEPPGRLVHYAVGDADNKWYGTWGSTALTNASPAGGSEIGNTAVITFDVLDREAELGRVLIAIKYASMGGATELAWDGSEPTGPFLVTSVPIVNGRRYSVLREAGWPAAPTVRVFLTNQGGREI